MHPNHVLKHGKILVEIEEEENADIAYVSHSELGVTMLQPFPLAPGQTYLT